MQQFRDVLEGRQITVYFCAVALAGAAALLFPQTARLEAFINPALALMLYATFLQVPMAELGRAFGRLRFMAALLAANFVVIPLLVAGLVQFLPADPMLRLGVLLVLMAPCIDYVITFAHLGRADARMLLAATPALLVAQMLLLPVYLGVMLGDQARGLVQIQPFVNVFVWLILVPLLLAALTQKWAGAKASRAGLAQGLGLLPVPATALVLFVVVAAVVPRLGSAMSSVLPVIPIYVAFAAVAPLIGWGVARLFGIEVRAGRAIAFSTGTRNSLVVLPLAFAVPGALPILPAIIVAQTLVELLAELVYVRLIARLGRE
ncbi:arsenic resistance protein [Pusillimonas sp.]|uniref:arsenic resistance protein n=1 Tax=Pusillimonas sp. TaxID=3040095 RepID=UPI0037C9BDCA